MRSFERLRREVDSQLELVPPERIQEEVATDCYFGGPLFKKSAQMHMGCFGSGLAEATARHGALIHEHTPVQRLERRHGSSYRVRTPRRRTDPPPARRLHARP